MSLLSPNQILINRYQVTSYLNEGGMQEVYLAEDLTFRRNVVCKIPKNSSAEKRFQRSAKVSASINHPNVAKTLDYIDDPTQPILVEEYVPFGDLDKCFRTYEVLDPHLVAKIFHHIARGLSSAHHKGIIHRDIKPSNILINSKGELKITDFGVAAELVSSIAMCGTFLGTWKYMSPERIRNQSYGYSSDIWSYGLVMMECATGQYPFQEFANCIEMAQMILDSDVPELPTSFSFEFRDFLRSCLHRDPLKRVPADLLLSAPWLTKHKALSYDSSVKIVRNWIRSL